MNYVKFFESILDIIVPFGPFLRKTEREIIFYNYKDLLLRVVPTTFFIYWIFSFIPLIGGLIYYFVFVSLSAKRHIALKNLYNQTDKLKIYLWYYTVIIIGFGGIWSFIGHTFLADTVAAQIGWVTGSPFQTELAFYTLGSGIAGIFAIWLRGHMITALVLSKSIFWYGAGFVHIQEAIINKNYYPLNIGGPLLGDIVIPTILLILLIKILNKESPIKQN